MLKVNAFVELDLAQNRYVVTCINVDTLEEVQFHVGYEEAQDQQIHDDPESYAAMKGIRLYTEMAEGLNGKAN